MQRLFEKQEPREKRRLLNFVVSNSTWRGGELAVTFRQPFDLLAETALAHARKKAAGGVASGFSQIWLPKSDRNYYEAVQLPNAHIVKGQIVRIVPDGIVMADG